MKLLLKRVSAEYDLVLLDTPPVLAVTDAVMLGSRFGSIILVARVGVTVLGEIEESAKRLVQSGSSVTGAVFNGVRHRPGLYRYGYQSYRYAGAPTGQSNDA